MRFAAKVGLVLMAVGVLPVALLGLVSYTVSRDELQRTVGRMQTQAAEDLALFTERYVGTSIESPRLAVSALPFDDFSRGEISAVLDIPYRQLPFLSLLALGIGHRFGSRLGKPVEVIGGVVLIGIGLRILLSHFIGS